MKKMLLIIALLVAPLAASADWGRSYEREHQVRFWNEVDGRLSRLNRRIERGIRQGDLTRWEAMKLKREYRRIDRRIERMRHKRWLSMRDKSRLLSDLDDAGSRIYKLKHNSRTVRHDGRFGHYSGNDSRRFAHADGNYKPGIDRRY